MRRVSLAFHFPTVEAAAYRSARDGTRRVLPSARAPAPACRPAPALASYGLGSLAARALAAPARARPLVYVTEKHSNDVAVIDAATNTVITHVSIGESPSEIAVTPSGHLVYAVNAGDSRTTSRSSTWPRSRCMHTIPVGKQPLGVVFRPDGAVAYVTNTGADSVAVIDTATADGHRDDQGRRQPGGARRHAGRALRLRRQRAESQHAGAGTVSVIDTATKTVVTDVAVGKNPFARGHHAGRKLGLRREQQLAAHDRGGAACR